MIGSHQNEIIYNIIYDWPRNILIVFIVAFNDERLWIVYWRWRNESRINVLYVFLKLHAKFSNQNESRYCNDIHLRRPITHFSIIFRIVGFTDIGISSLDIGTYIIVTIMTFWTTSYCKKWLYPHLPLLQESITFDRRTCSIFINLHKMTIASDVLVGPWILWSCAMALMVLKLTN